MSDETVRLIHETFGYGINARRLLKTLEQIRALPTAPVRRS